MTQRRQMALRLETYAEVRAILAALKNMALAELHRLAELHAHQRIALQTAAQAAADFVGFYPPRPAQRLSRACVVIGSERGFCGDFNTALAKAARDREAAGERVLLVGARLSERAEQIGLRASVVGGASVSEELGVTLEGILGWIESAQRTVEGALRVNAVLQDPEQPRLLERRLMPLPLPRDDAGVPRRAQPPMLTLAPQDLLPALADQALMLALNEAFSVSLIAENRHRLELMEGALHRLDERSAALTRRMHAARQEDITQEIEVIMLSAQALDEDASSDAAL